MRPVSAPDIENGTVVVDGDTIVYAGPREGAPEGSDVALGDVVLSPGLVNAHTHLDLTALRGKFDGLNFFEWIRALTKARSAMSPEELLESSRAGIREGLRAGDERLGFGGVAFEVDRFGHGRAGRFLKDLAGAPR